MYFINIFAALLDISHDSIANNDVTMQAQYIDQTAHTKFKKDNTRFEKHNSCMVNYIHGTIKTIFME